MYATEDDEPRLPALVHHVLGGITLRRIAAAAMVAYMRRTLDRSRRGSVELRSALDVTDREEIRLKALSERLMRLEWKAVSESSER